MPNAAANPNVSGASSCPAQDMGPGNFFVQFTERASSAAPFLPTRILNLNIPRFV